MQAQLRNTCTRKLVVATCLCNCTTYHSY